MVDFIDLKEKHPQLLRGIVYCARFELFFVVVFWFVFVWIERLIPDYLHELGYFKTAMSVSAWTFVLTFAWTILRLVYEFVLHKSYNYYIKDNSFVVSYGVFKKFKDISVLTRIADVKINRKLLHRLLGLSEIEVFTQNDTVSGAKIPYLGLESCMEIQSLLLSKIDDNEIDPEDLTEALKASSQA